VRRKVDRPRAGRTGTDREAISAHESLVREQHAGEHTARELGRSVRIAGGRALWKATSQPTGVVMPE
jgi:hypothetical protein